jgi:addiction module HigA family antidote
MIVGDKIMPKTLDPILPGEILWKEFMEPAGISQNKLARDLDVPETRIGDIVHGRRGISADSALRLGLYFGTTPEFWLDLQTRYDLKISRRDLLPTIAKNIRPLREAS